MKQAIIKISDSFASEAAASPKMLEDLAAMERYMAESYDGRTFVELIQNADDAKASKIAVLLVGNTLVVANDGRPFNEEDVLAISRSGASNKKRGRTIGYRGVGFKSATAISTEIIIRSGGACFTFSKSACARRLGVKEECVPTVRIPFPFDEDGIPQDVENAIMDLERKGFTTFFIFLDVKMQKISSELFDFDAGWLLFLKSVYEVDIRCGTIEKNVLVSRERLSRTDSLIEINQSKLCWYVVTSNKAAVAFRYEKGRGIIPCDTDEAVFHCFMPTLDKTGFPFKISADFSTDPSRKHLIVDTDTVEAIEAAQELLAESVLEAIANNNVSFYPIFTLLGIRTALSNLSSRFESGLFHRLRNMAWIPSILGGLLKPSSVKLVPKWLDIDEWKTIAQMDGFQGVAVPDYDFLETAANVEALLFKLGASEVSAIDLAFAMDGEGNVDGLPNAILAKLFAYSFRIEENEACGLDFCFIPLEKGSVQFCNLTRKSRIAPDFLSGVKSILTDAELNKLSLVSESFAVNLANRKKLPTHKEGYRPEAPVLNKWKTPVQNCIAAETRAGNAAKKASTKCSGYDVVSTGSDGIVSYLAVKSVASLNDPFQLSDAEYEAARYYGDCYKVYLFAAGEKDIEYAITVNPAHKANARKIVKEWAWIVEDYRIVRGDSHERDMSNGSLDCSMHFDLNFDDMDGDQFERFCAKTLIGNGYKDVSLTKGSGDQGIDLIAYRDGIKYGIQCKCYTADIGNDAVQEAYAGKTFYECNVAIVMTNRHFTPAAIQLAESNNVILWGREMILKMSNSTE